ncbi:MAG: hypothetical protein ACREJC_01785, partial [Tepidisphaeraceae bacterium]
MRTPSWCAACIMMMCVMPGCGGLSQPYPNKEFFAIDPGRPAPGTLAFGDEVLCVRRLTVASPY